MTPYGVLKSNPAGLCRGYTYGAHSCRYWRGNFVARGVRSRNRRRERARARQLARRLIRDELRDCADCADIR